jgi:hypothetical protein
MARASVYHAATSRAYVADFARRFWKLPRQAEYVRIPPARRTPSREAEPIYSAPQLMAAVSQQSRHNSHGHSFILYFCFDLKEFGPCRIPARHAACQRRGRPGFRSSTACRPDRGLATISRRLQLFSDHDDDFNYLTKMCHQHARRPRMSRSRAPQAVRLSPARRRPCRNTWASGRTALSGGEQTLGTAELWWGEGSPATFPTRGRRRKLSDRKRKV